VAAPVHAQSGRTLARLFCQNEDDCDRAMGRPDEEQRGLFTSTKKTVESFPDSMTTETIARQMQADQGVNDSVGVSRMDAKGTNRQRMGGDRWLGVKEIPSWRSLALELRVSRLVLPLGPLIPIKATPRTFTALRSARSC